MESFTVDWFTKYGVEWLKRMGDLKDKPIQVLEIGSYEGQSTCWIIKNLLQHKDSHITCVDVWDGNDPCLKEKTKQAYDRFISNIKQYYRKVNVIKDSSITVLPKLIEYGQSYDIIFVDGNHEGEYVLQDLINGWKLLKNNGWMILDDYNWQWEGLKMQPKEAFNKFLETNPQGIQWKELEGRQLYIKKETPT